MYIYSESVLGWFSFIYSLDRQHGFVEVARLHMMKNFAIAARKRTVHQRTNASQGASYIKPRSQRNRGVNATWD